MVNANGRLVCDTERCAAPTGNAPYFQASSCSGRLFVLFVEPGRPAAAHSSPNRSKLRHLFRWFCDGAVPVASSPFLLTFSISLLCRRHTQSPSLIEIQLRHRTCRESLRLPSTVPHPAGKGGSRCRRRTYSLWCPAQKAEPVGNALNLRLSL